MNEKCNDLDCIPTTTVEMAWKLKMFSLSLSFIYKSSRQQSAERAICNFFFSDELIKLTISDFPKQTHFGHILITFFFHHLIDPHFDIVFQPMA